MSTVLGEELTLAVVDDDEVYLEHTAMILGRAGGFVVHVAASGSELGNLLADRSIDAIVLDLNLGADSGFSVVEQLRLLHPVLPPIVMLTGDGSEGTVIRALRLGVSDYVSKHGLQGDELVSAIMRAVERRKQEVALLALASMDGLTGLPNRRTFDSRLDQEFRRAQRNAASVSLLMIDVDLFKALNDTFGHQAGDHHLTRIARAVGGEMLRPGDFAARYGGEEFGVVLPDTPLGGAVVVAERLLEAIAALALPHPSSPSGVVTVSIGAACSVDLAAGSPEVLIAKADAALYRAKHLGRNQVATHNAAPPGLSYPGPVQPSL